MSVDTAQSYVRLPSGKWGYITRPRCQHVRHNAYGRCVLAATRQAFCGNHHAMLAIDEMRAANPSLSYGEALKLYTPDYLLKQ